MLARIYYKTKSGKSIMKVREYYKLESELRKLYQRKIIATAKNHWGRVVGEVEDTGVQEPDFTWWCENFMWSTKDGEKISVYDMEDRHLLNTIKFLERKTEERRRSDVSACLCISNVLNPDSEASWQMDNELQALMDNPDANENYLPEIYYVMQSEAQDRGLL